MTDKELQAFEQLEAEYAKLPPWYRLAIIASNTEGISIDHMIAVLGTNENELLERISSERLERYLNNIHGKSN
jgi:hypothetical protein